MGIKANIADMSPLAAEVSIKCAEAGVRTAEATHTKPAMWETVRSGMGYAVLLAVVVAACFKADQTFLGWTSVAAVITIGGGIGIPQAIKAWKQAKSIGS
jgi:hypothetical protein